MVQTTLNKELEYIRRVVGWATILDELQYKFIIRKFDCTNGVRKITFLMIEKPAFS